MTELNVAGARKILAFKGICLRNGDKILKYKFIVRSIPR